uniref:Uncharacterized protein LOC107432399 n=1 Tax=Rhizophora mucronata TaxID=61149 RepID=A0A2P2IS57_RHIMU
MFPGVLGEVLRLSVAMAMRTRLDMMGIQAEMMRHCWRGYLGRHLGHTLL